jgi:hypothetical protein
LSPTQAGWLGVWLFVGSSAVIVLELAIAGVWSARLARRGRALAVVLDRERGVVRQDLARLRAAMAETRELWRPYARALRWLRHPLVAALIASYWRRWRRPSAR